MNRAVDDLARTPGCSSIAISEKDFFARAQEFFGRAPVFHLKSSQFGRHDDPTARR
jgi:hypothetical protein